MTTHHQVVRFALIASAFFFAASTSGVQASIVVNGSFENTDGTWVNEGGGVMNTPLTPGSTIIPGWTVTNAQMGWITNGNIYGPATPYGAFLLDLTGSHDDNVFAGITQTISTTPLQTYRLSLSIGADQGHPLSSGTKSVSVSAGAANTTFTFVPVGSGNQWGDFNFDFVANSASTAITITGLSSGVGNQYLGLDNIAVNIADNPVPEPSSLALWVGASILFLKKSRRKVSNASRGR